MRDPIGMTQETAANAGLTLGQRVAPVPVTEDATAALEAAGELPARGVAERDAAQQRAACLTVVEL